MLEPVKFDWNTPVFDVVEVLREEYSAQYPALCSARLDTLMDLMRDDFADAYLPVLGQELESLGLALVEQDENDDSINLLIVPGEKKNRLVAEIEQQGQEAIVHRQDDQLFGAPAVMPLPPADPLLDSDQSIVLRHAFPIAPGWTFAINDEQWAAELVDIGQWPALRRVNGKFDNIVLASATRADGAHAWIEQNADGISGRNPYARLFYSQQVATLPINSHGLWLPPKQSAMQRRDPEFSLAFVGNDLLLVDRNMIFIYRDIMHCSADVAAEPELLFTAAPVPRPVKDDSAIIQTSDGRVCIFCRGQFFAWRDGEVHPISFTYPSPSLLSEISSPVACGASSIAWLEDDSLCHAHLDTRSVSRYYPQRLPFYGYTLLENVQDGWLLLKNWNAPHRSTDLGQLWHFASDQIAHIRYGTLPLEGGIECWNVLPSGEVVVGDHTRHINLGPFNALLSRLPRSSISEHRNEREKQ